MSNVQHIVIVHGVLNFQVKWRPEETARCNDDPGDRAMVGVLSPFILCAIVSPFHLCSYGVVMVYINTLILLEMATYLIFSESSNCDVLILFNLPMLNICFNTIKTYSHKKSPRIPSIIKRLQQRNLIITLGRIQGRIRSNPFNLQRRRRMVWYC